MKVIMFIGCIFTGSSAAAQMRNIAGIVIDTFSKEYLPSATVSINGKVMSPMAKGYFPGHCLLQPWISDSLFLIQDIKQIRPCFIRFRIIISLN